MAQTAVTAQIHQAFDINRNITAQFAFNKVVFVNYFTDFGNIFVRQFMNAAFTSNARRKRRISSTRIGHA